MAVSYHSAAFSWTSRKCVRSEVLTAVTMRSTIYWNVTLCSLVVHYTYSPETSVDFYCIMQYHIPEVLFKEVSLPLTLPRNHNAVEVYSDGSIRKVEASIRVYITSTFTCVRAKWYRVPKYTEMFHNVLDITVHTTQTLWLSSNENHRI
jgi:hypothetical protein